MKYYPAIFVLEPFHKEFLISLLIGKFFIFAATNT